MVVRPLASGFLIALLPAVAGCLAPLGGPAPPDAGTPADPGAPAVWTGLEAADAPPNASALGPVWSLERPFGVVSLAAPFGASRAALAVSYGTDNRTVVTLANVTDGSVVDNATYRWYSCCDYPPAYVDPVTGTGFSLGFSLGAVGDAPGANWSGLDHDFTHPHPEWGPEQALVADGPTADGGFVVGTWLNAHLYLLKPGRPDPVFSYPIAGEWIDVDVSRDGRRVAAATHTNAYLFGTDPPRLLQNVSLGEGYVFNAVAVSADGSRWAFLDRDQADRTSIVILEGAEEVLRVPAGRKGIGSLWFAGGQLVADLWGPTFVLAETGDPAIVFPEGHTVWDVTTTDGVPRVLTGEELGRNMTLWRPVDGAWQPVWTGRSGWDVLKGRIVEDGVVTAEWGTTDGQDRARLARYEVPKPSSRAPDNG